MAELVDDQFGRVGIEALVDRRHDAHLHQRLDDIGAALGHAAGQLLHRDAFGNYDVANDAGGILLRLLGAFFLFARAFDGGQRAHAFAGVFIEGLDDRHLPGTPARLFAARGQRLCRRAQAGALHLARGLFFFLGFRHGWAARGSDDIGLDTLDRGLALRLGRGRLGDHVVGRRGCDRRIYFAPGLGGLAARFLGRRQLGLFGGAADGLFGLLDAANFVVALGFFQHLQARRPLTGGQIGEMGAILGAQFGRRQSQILVGRHLGHLSADSRGIGALALDLDGHRLRTAMGEGLLDLAGVHRLPQLTLTA
jgi:hypothetical protein